MLGGLRIATLAGFVAAGAASNAAACEPEYPVRPKSTPFLAMLADASAIVEGRVIEKRDLSPMAGETITYVDIDVRKVLAGASSDSKIRIWSSVGVSTCPTPNHLASLRVGDEGIFAIRAVRIHPRATFQVENDVRTLIVTHAIARPYGARMLGLRYDNACPFGCVYFEPGLLDELRKRIAARKKP